MPLADTQLQAVNIAFSKQSVHFDEDDLANPILQQWRQQIYAHVDQLIKPGSSILELNAGTGIDAVRFARQGHRVHATDLSDGMIRQIERKINQFRLGDCLTVQQLSYSHLDQLKGQKFDFIFSNFGGLNCCEDLTRVAGNIPAILARGGVVTWVIMPPVCIWEILGILKGNRNAARRLTKNGVVAQLEGERFHTWYHSLQSVKKAFGKNIQLIRLEGLGAISPPPYAANFALHHPFLFKILQRVDGSAKNYFPFNRWADHIIVSFQLADELAR
ncbi:MAG TPA: methyltransferase domain-containing protein [Cyclobacteriaceae bacterium]|nr:methyltransferase domain-containing protein [Cyclobacteriaceae bacterium]